MSKPPLKFTKPESALLRQLADEVWENELNEKLEQLFEDFLRWADKGYSAFELSEKIHGFHHGTSRKVYGRYNTLDPVTIVARAIAISVLDDEALGDKLRAKLSDQIDTFRKIEQKKSTRDMS